MDPAGARALARRLAEGKETSDMTLAERLAAEAQSAKTGSAEKPLDPTEPPPSDDGVVYIRPSRRSSEQEVWVYVRASDGHLRRARSGSAPPPLLP
jgi:hypothetical protein